MMEYLIFHSNTDKSLIKYEFGLWKSDEKEEMINKAQMWSDMEELHLKMKHHDYTVIEFENRIPLRKIFDTQKGAINELFQEKTKSFFPVFTEEDSKTIDELISICINSYNIDMCYKLKNLKKRIDYCLYET